MDHAQDVTIPGVGLGAVDERVPRQLQPRRGVAAAAEVVVRVSTEEELQYHLTDHHFPIVPPLSIHCAQGTIYFVILDYNTSQATNDGDPS